MNIFRLAGDFAHLASIFILVHKIQLSKSCRGISFKTQLLYTVVFVTRYLDIFAETSLYRFLMKTFFIGSSVYVLYLMKVKYRPTHDGGAIDTIKLEWLMGGCAILALIFNYHWDVMEVLWTFSIYLEAVAILPQLFMLQRTGEAETITTHYIFALGAYRALYIPNWFYRYVTKNEVDPISILAGLVQTGLYLDFFYGDYHDGELNSNPMQPSSTRYAEKNHPRLTTHHSSCPGSITVYFTKVMKGEKFELPA